MAISLASSARAQIMEMVPTNSMVVIKIKNIQDVNSKIAALSQQWGLANMRPELNDLLGTLLTATNMGPGLNKAGDAGMAIMMPAAGANEPDMVMLVSVTDFKAFAGALPNAKPEGDLTTFSMGGNPKPGYAADWGKYAAISPSKELIAKKGSGVKVSAASAKELDSKDLIVYANMAEIRNVAMPHFQQMKPMMLQGISQAMMNNPGANPKYAPLMKAYFTQILNVVEATLRDSAGASFGLNLSKEGISTTFMIDFNADSYAGQQFKAMKGSDASFTAGLPDAKYYFFGGFAMDKAGAQMITDFFAPIEKEVVALGADAKPIADYISSMKDFMSVSKQANFGMAAPAAAAIGKEGFFQMINVITGDSAKMLAAQKQMFATEDELMKMMGMGGGVKMKFTSTPNAKTVEGVSLDAFALSYDGQPQTPQEQQMMMMMKMIYGPNGMSGYTGAAGADKVISAIGVNDELLTAAVKAAKSGEDPLAKGSAAKVTAALPQNRLGAFYLQVDAIATTVLDVMAAKGVPGGVKLPPNLPPLGGAVSTEGTALRIDGYIPAQTVQSLISAGLQVWMQNMNGGGQPGGL